MWGSVDIIEEIIVLFDLQEGVLGNSEKTTKKQCYEKFKIFIFAALFSLNITEGIHLDKRSE